MVYWLLICWPGDTAIGFQVQITGFSLNSQFQSTVTESTKEVFGSGWEESLHMHLYWCQSFLCRFTCNFKFLWTKAKQQYCKMNYIRNCKEEEPITHQQKKNRQESGFELIWVQLFSLKVCAITWISLLSHFFFLI